MYKDNPDIAALQNKIQQLERELDEARNSSVDIEKRYRTMLDLVFDGYWVIDENANFVYVNDSACEMLGYSCEEFMQMSISDIDIEEDLEISQQHAENIRTEGKDTFPAKHRARSGEIKDVIVRASRLPGEKNHIIAFVHDVTEQKRSDERFIAFMNHFPGAAFIKDKTNRLIYCNDFYAQMLNSTAKELLNKDGLDNLPPELEEQYRIENEKVIEKKEVLVAESQFEAQGTTTTWQTYKFPIDTGSETMLGAISLDVSDRKQYEEQLIEARKEAEKGDNLKTAFLQNLSHEIRTPLNAISGFAGLLNKPGLPGEKLNEFISIIQNSSNQLVSIVSDIITISSLETGQEKVNMTGFCLNHVILELITVYKAQSLEKEIVLDARLGLSDKESEIYTDKTKLIQILSNLIGNAFKFTKEGRVQIGYELNKDKLFFYVRDTGVGIAKEYQDKIFHRFQQGNNDHSAYNGGTGLGLSISKAFLLLMGGDISVKSEPGKGSEFTFWLPYKHTSISENEVDYPDLTDRNTVTVLVAEDEDDNFLLFNEFMSYLKVKIIHARDGKQAVELFKENEDIQLIFMDIKMPVLDGVEATKRIRNIRPDVPIIAQSAYALDFEVEKFRKVFDDYLTKPIEISKLNAILDKYLKTVSPGFPLNNFD